jgi:hypothetical protein
MALFAVLAAPAFADGFLGGVLGGGTVGTKFACCRPESFSCLGGGGATGWTTTLRDRALTQVDAKLRCGVDRMYWGTHSCPADTPCSSVGGTTSRPPEKYIATFRNNTAKDAFVAFKTYENKRKFAVHAWFKVRPFSNKEFTFTDTACLAYSQNGKDSIAVAKKGGAIFTGELSTMRVHPKSKTDVTYSLNNQNQYSVNIFVDNVFDPAKSYHGFSSTGLRALFDDAKLKTFNCFIARKENMWTSLEK